MPVQSLLFRCARVPVIDFQAMTTAEKYLATSSTLFDQAHIELQAGDLVQASEKFWGAAAQALKATAQQRGWEHNSHAHFFAIVRNIIDETGDKEILDLFNAANLLHVNFYEGILRDDEVLAMSRRVSELVNRLTEANTS
ncbi:MAG: PaREP1/PaREP8 domain-contain protein [Chloroflexi bacterium]|nr:PaREP1/PaREP8 domain-contain protein [Chloroflexota bacterium]